MVVVIAPCRPTVMHYGSFKPLSWPDKRETSRADLAPRVLDRLQGTVHAAPRHSPLKRPAAPAAPNELEVIQRRLSQQLEEKQLVLRDSIRQQQEQLSALKTQLEEQTYSRVDPHIVNLHLELLHKLEVKRKKQERVLQGLEAAYSEKTGKLKTPPASGHCGQRKYKNNSFPASAALSTPPSLSDRGDTESDSISSHDSVSLVAPCQHSQPVTANFDSCHSKQVLNQQLNFHTDPNSSRSSSSSSNISGEELQQGGHLGRYQDCTMAKGDCNSDASKELALTMPMPGHNGALRVYGKDHVQDPNRSQYQGVGVLHQKGEQQHHQLQQHQLEPQQQQQQYQLEQQQQQQQQQQQKQQQQQQQQLHQQQQHLHQQQKEQQQQQDFYASTRDKSLPSESNGDSLRTFGQPPSSDPYLMHPPEHMPSMLGKPLVHHTGFSPAGQQSDRTIPYSGDSSPSSYQSMGTISNSHRPGQRESDSLHYPSTAPYLHHPTPHHQLADRLPLPPIRMGGRSRQQHPYNDYLQGQGMSHTSQHGDSLDHMAATLTGLGPSQNHTPALVTDSVLGLDSDELGQYMGPGSNAQWPMGGQRQWLQPMNGIGPEHLISQQDGGMQGGRVHSDQGYGWV